MPANNSLRSRAGVVVEGFEGSSFANFSKKLKFKKIVFYSISQYQHLARVLYLIVFTRFEHRVRLSVNTRHYTQKKSSFRTKSFIRSIRFPEFRISVIVNLYQQKLQNFDSTFYSSSSGFIESVQLLFITNILYKTFM